MNTIVTPQLYEELQKIKEGDYSSYQQFYEQTSQYLYGIIWNTVNNEDVANCIINQLYTDIYQSIATELTDNSMFFVWAGNKAQALSTTYVKNHECSASDDDSKKDAAAVAMANASVDVFAGSGASEGIGIAGVNAIADGGGVAGINTVSGGIGAVGIGAVAGNTASKVGLGIGAKIAIGIVATALVIGGGVGIFSYAKSKNKDKDKVTTETTEITTEEIATAPDAQTTEEISEATTEGMQVDNTARYQAFYDKMLEENVVTSNGDTSIKYAELIDIRNDGTEQLLLARKSFGDNSGYVTELIFDFEIWDYIDDELVMLYSKQITEISEGHCQMEMFYDVNNSIVINIYGISNDVDVLVTNENGSIVEYARSDFESKYGKLKEQGSGFESIKNVILLISGSDIYKEIYSCENDNAIDVSKTKEYLMNNIGINHTEEWREIYKSYLQLYPQDSNAYALTDINHDGIPELICESMYYSCNRYGVANGIYFYSNIYVNEQNGAVVATRYYDNPNEIMQIMILNMSDNYLAVEGLGNPQYLGGTYLLIDEDNDCTESEFNAKCAELFGGDYTNYKLDMSKYDVYTYEQILEQIDNYVVDIQ